MVRATLLLNLLVLALVTVVLLGVELPAPDGLAAAASEVLSRVQTWAGAGWNWAQDALDATAAALDRLIAWAAHQLG
jgi:hypothetical protein